MMNGSVRFSLYGAALFLILTALFCLVSNLFDSAQQSAPKLVFGKIRNPQLTNRDSHNANTPLLSSSKVWTLLRIVSFQTNNVDNDQQEEEEKEAENASLDEDGSTKIFHAALPKHSMTLNAVAEPFCDTVKQYTGYLSVEKKNFFYWMFESRNDPFKDPVILWLNGGPGCSSMTGLFMELGPCSVNAKGDATVYNHNSWNSNASLIFLDQPVNTGFSYGGARVTDSHAAAEDVYAFLQLFFQEKPQFSGLDFHIAGESYAGHYIPAIGAKFLQFSNQSRVAATTLRSDHEWMNASSASQLVDIPLRSLMIGNGLTDPLVQYGYYSAMACNNSYAPALPQQTCDMMDTAYERGCKPLIRQCYETGSRMRCLFASQICNAALIMPYARTGQNVYDVRRKCGKNPLCYDILDSISIFLNREDTQQKLGIKPHRKFQGCNLVVNQEFAFKGDWMKPFQPYVTEVLEANVDVLVYAGDADFICNWMGNEAWTLQLPWAHKDQFNAVKPQEWKSPISSKNVTAVTTGIVRELPSKDSKGRFTFLRAFNAGHMLPYDIPEAALDMLTRWITKQSLAN